MYRYLSLQKICILIIRSLRSVFFRSMDFLIDLKIFYKCSRFFRKFRNTKINSGGEIQFFVLHSVNLDKNRTRRRIGEGDFSVSPKRKNTVFLLLWWQKASKFSACGGPVFCFILPVFRCFIDSGIFLSEIPFFTDSFVFLTDFVFKNLLFYRFWVPNNFVFFTDFTNPLKKHCPDFFWNWRGYSVSRSRIPQRLSGD